MFKKAVTCFEAFEDFIVSREAMLVSPGTIRFYRFTAKRFVEWLDVESPKQITSKHIRLYLAELSQKGLSDSYIHGHARAIRTLLRFLQEEGYRSETIRITMPSVGKKRLPMLSLSELKVILDACGNVRDKLVVLLIADCGIRRAELCSLNWEDVDEKSGVMRIKKGKGNKYRTVVIGTQTRKVLTEYRKNINPTGNEPLIQTSNRKRLSTMGLRSLFVRLGNKTELHITPHALRRTFATLALRSGMNIVHLQSFLGHASLEMTRHYIQMLDEDLIQAHENYGPIDSLLN